MPRFTRKGLLKRRIGELTLNKIYERKYQEKKTSTNVPIFYLYQLCFLAKASENTNESNVEEAIENDDSDVSTMMSYSKLQFDGCDFLGLIKNSLTITGKTTSQEDSEAPEEISPDHIKVSSDVVNNTIDIQYFIVESCEDLEITFKIMMRSELKISLIERRNIKIGPEAHTFHRNGFTTETETCHVLHKGFRISTIKNEPEPPKFTAIETVDLKNNTSDIYNLPSNLYTNLLGFPSRRAGSSRNKTPKRKPTLLSSWISSQSSTSRNERSTHGEKVLIFIEYLNHPTFIVFMDLGRTVKFLKQTVKKTTQKLKYHVHDVKDIRLIFNAKPINEEDTLSEAFGNLQKVRCSMVTTKPYLAPEIALRAAPESRIQAETLHRFKSCLILFRNVHACNRAAETFLSSNERIRFNEPTVLVTGIVYSEDLGKMIIMIAEELERLSTNFLKLSNKMIKDENLVQGSDEYENYKCMIQNLMDSARYAGPLFQALSKFTIPLSQPSPRPISIVQQR